MKKIFIFLAFILILTGCSKTNDKTILKDINNKIEKAQTYSIIANLEIYRNEEKFSYDIVSSYLKGDYFKVTLTNKNNNHEQIILKNSDAVYVLTPSLNKSFKFQSEWPYNNSQIYLLQPIISDLQNDKERVFEKVDDGYILTSTVNYSTEKDFKKQRVYFDLENNIKKVEVLDSNDKVKMCLTVISIQYDVKFENDHFDIKKYQNNQLEEKNNEKDENDITTSSELSEIVYPMYVPVDTYLTSQNIVNTENGERAILTFAGESSFTMIQENIDEVDSVDFIYGDPYLILDTVGAVTDYSVTWVSDGVEYSIMSDNMNVDELLTVAQSISVEAISK